MTAGQPSSVPGWDCHRLGAALIFFSHYQGYVSFHCQTYGKPLMRLTLLLLNMQVVSKQVRLAVVMNT